MAIYATMLNCILGTQSLVQALYVASPELSGMTDLCESAVSRITPALQSRISFPYLALHPEDMTTVGPNDSIKIVFSMWSNPSCHSTFHCDSRAVSCSCTGS